MKKCDGWKGMLKHFSKPDSKCPDPAHGKLQELVNEAIEFCAKIADLEAKNDKVGGDNWAKGYRCSASDIASKIRKSKR